MDLFEPTTTWMDYKIVKKKTKKKTKRKIL